MSNNISVKIEGGLGNQMFQFAFAKKLSIKHNREITLDLSSIENDKLRVFELNKVIVPEEFTKYSINTIKNSYLERLKYKISQKTGHPCLGWKCEPHLGYDQNVFSAISRYYKGYWQSPFYFDDIKDILVASFDFEKFCDSDLLGKLDCSQGNLVSIHVRRGDYITDKNANAVHGGVCDRIYYSKAVNQVLERMPKTKFLIFSDDIKWCKSEFNWLENKQIVDFTCSHFEDFSLMMHCSANIIANSSFSWWAAYLNKNSDKFVIAPKKWFNHDEKIDIYPEDWILL